MKSLVLAAAAVLALATPVFAQDCAAGQSFTAGDITVTGALTRATLPGAKAAGGFMTITNAGAAADRLVGVETDAAKMAEMHEMKMEGDVMKMTRLDDGLEIPAGGTVTLEPGGYHVMMMGLAQGLAEGGCLEVTLTFERAGKLPVLLAVGGTDADMAPMGHMGH
ncbi:MAG TPA: copper chaperone PCu(A)C [Devosia sp.]